MPTLPTNQAEDIARAIRTALTLYLPSYLLEVQNRRNAQWSTSLVLDSPVEIVFGFDPALLTYPNVMSLFPRVSIVAAPRGATTVTSGDRFAEAEHTVIIEWLCAALASEDAAVLSWRYGEAILGVLTDKDPFAGFSVNDIIPPVDEGTPIALQGDLNSPGPLGYVTGSSVQLPVRGRYAR